MIELFISNNPTPFTDDEGFYLKGKWYSVSDIGKVFEGKVLTEEEYLRVEDEYVRIVLTLMDIACVSKLTVSDLEIQDYCLSLLSNKLQTGVLQLSEFSNGKLLSRDEIARVIRMVLRDLVWFRMSGENSFYVHFGQDLTMYAGFNGDLGLLDCLNTFLFVEVCTSPYWPEDQ